ncbi:putative pentatricopeptide repeat-containing protein [Cocos nucifera]|uniref:cinnamyl-alcohol dehydrogenase n=1 Tax=Cocos nucifera TaxID=13894 RepID=A0A8K0ILH0_COCNU|nr:putative pentatricopeptide repeat-containing protein [Cocos nucifera]
MAKLPEEEHPEKAFGWAAHDSNGLLSPFKFSRSHEIVGTVTEVGTEVQKFRVGDAVGVGCMVGGCDECEDCKRGWESYCPKSILTYSNIYHDGTVTYGGYSDKIVVEEHYVVRFPDGLPKDAGAPLLCAGITVYSPLRYYGLAEPGIHLGVVGLGGLGHLAVKFAKAFGAEVTVISTSPGKQKEAIDHLGADAFLVSRNAEQMKVDIGFAHLNLAAGRKLVGGSATGGMQETQEMLDFAAKHNITAEVEVIPMNYINTAMERLAKADVKYRFVIDVGNRCLGTSLLRSERSHENQNTDARSGSSPSLCELLQNNFRDWNSCSIAWDMLANVYVRLEMIHDALYVLSKMDSLNMQASVSTYDSLMYNLRHTDMVWDIYKEIRACGVSHSEYTYDILIDSLCKQQRLQDAISLFQDMQGQKKIKPCIITFNTLMSGLCNAGLVEVAESILSQMLKYGLHPDRYSYNTLIHGLCVAGSMEEALKLSEDMEKDGIVLDVVTYNILINGYRLLGLISEVWKLIKMMILQGLKPNLVTYTILITGHCEKGDVEEGFRVRREVIAQGIQLNFVAYSVLLNALFKKGQIAEVHQLLDETEAIGLHMDLVAYSILIHGYCKLGEIERALQVCQMMCSKQVMPNSFTHGAILSSLCKKGMLVEARWYLDNLATNGQMVDIILYNIVIDGYAKIGDVDSALELYEQILKLGLSPSIVTYNTLIFAFCKIRKLTVAEHFLRQIELNGFNPTVVTYTTLMDAFVGAGNTDSMLRMFDEMIEKAVMPNVITYSVVMKGLCKQGRLQKAMAILNDMHIAGICADQITYNTLIQGFCEVRNIEMAFRIHDEMLQHNLTPTPVTYNLLINILCLKGKVDYAEQLLNTLLDKGVSLRKFAYTTIVKAQCAKGMSVKAIMLFDRIIRSGFEVSIKDFSAAINRLCKRNFVNEAIIFIKMMLHVGIYPDEELYIIIGSAFIKKNELQSLFALQAMIVKSGILTWDIHGLWNQLNYYNALELVRSIAKQVDWMNKFIFDMWPYLDKVRQLSYVSFGRVEDFVVFLSSIDSMMISKLQIPQRATQTIHPNTHKIDGTYQDPKSALRSTANPSRRKYFLESFWRIMNF